MAKLTELSCEEFLEKLASAAPTPGGGGGAAMAGALAAGLSSMVANLTIGKKGFEGNEARIKELLSQAEQLRTELVDLVQQDAGVFDSFMACYKLPKVTDAEKQARLDAIHAAAKGAAMVPMNIARAASKVLVIADELSVIGNPNVITDATCSAILARAALRCAVYNVYINLKLTKDDAFNKTLSKEMAQLREDAHALEDKVLEVTHKALL